jgi:UDP-N-acetylglucosamine:LPS N-acetylglucosamine transferase
VIIRNPIPGHEVRNVRFLTGIGAAITTGKGVTLEDAVRRILSEDTRAQMITAIREIQKPNAVRDLCDEAFRLGAEK